MRGLVIDYCRSKRAQKRGGDITFLSLDDVAAPAGSDGTFEQLDLALQELDALDPPLAQLVDLKFFCGFTFGELAAIRGVSERTVRRDWEKARLLLHHAINAAE
jgi:DNA-directed RNA polymerase specialized sigma24 family protein